MRLKSSLGVCGSANVHDGRPAKLHRLSAVMLALIVTGCTTVSEQPQATADPADPKARVPVTAYRSVVGGYVSQRPVEPVSWREQNERVTPRSGH